MKKAWVNKKEKKRLQRIEEIVARIHDGLVELGVYSENEIKSFMERLAQCRELRQHTPKDMMPYNDKPLFMKIFNDKELHEKTLSFFEKMPLDELAFLDYRNYSRYLDSEPQHFHGDIVITDPCYLVKNEDWEDALYDGLARFIPGSIERDTIYGDWSCTAFNIVNGDKRVIGEFCADSGMVCVCDLFEVMKYNPDYNYPETRPHTVTTIYDFDGDVWFEVKHSSRYDDFYVHVRGKGTNIKTGEPIEFITFQTGL